MPRLDGSMSQDLNDPDDPDPESVAEIELQDAMLRQVFDEVTRTFTNSKRRVTDIPGNNRVKLPRALPPNIEAQLLLRKEKFTEVYNKSCEEFCDSKRRQKQNLTKSQ